MKHGSGPSPARSAITNGPLMESARRVASSSSSIACRLTKDIKGPKSSSANRLSIGKKSEHPSLETRLADRCAAFVGILESKLRRPHDTRTARSHRAVATNASVRGSHETHGIPNVSVELWQRLF